MKTNFFELKENLSPQSDWTIVIKKIPAKDAYSVSVHVVNRNIKDSAVKLIPPINLKGTIAELDAKFFQAAG
jgi:hypothetical protein